MYFTLVYFFRLALYLWTKLICPVERAWRQKTTLRRLVVDDAQIHIMIDTGHEHECLIFLLVFKVQFAGNLIYLYSYILAVMVNFASRFYVSQALLCRRCAEVLQRSSTVFYPRKFLIYIEVCTISNGSWQKIPFAYRKCYRYVVAVINI